jgi:hypothetical protein
MDPLMVALSGISAAAVAAIGWIGVQIVKPWFDAKMAESKAFVEHVKAITTALAEFLTEVKRQTEETKTQTVQQMKQTVLLEDHGGKLDHLQDSIDTAMERQLLYIASMEAANKPKK